jgi:hypothetical protein
MDGNLASLAGKVIECRKYWTFFCLWLANGSVCAVGVQDHHRICGKIIRHVLGSVAAFWLLPIIGQCEHGLWFSFAI